MRVDFSSDAAWEALQATVGQAGGPDGEFKANVVYVNDPEFSGWDVARLVDWLTAADYPLNFAFVADATTMNEPDLPILCLGFNNPDDVKVFRVIPSELWSVENNLSIGNMDFSDFHEAVDAQGIFRGF
ncbi:hypothetical protein ACHAXA_002841 [Cyclostephanos tholiformis]|uniref:DUF6924 domain-containing protein n=1 Tax=Cyclostephanos tholiformis TaxID=382380 RepID=A0ABD3RZR4_9STRA